MKQIIAQITKRKIFLLFVVIFTGNLLLNAQNVTWPPERIIALTPEWKGERFPDGRPKVSDDLLERLKNIAMEEASVAKKRDTVA